MAFEKEEYKFPDEVDDNFEVVIEDDTPPEDRNREPMPAHIVDELEKDELDNYDEGVKQKLKQLKKVWHDERRAKEQALREQHEAFELAKKLYEENKHIKSVYNTGEQEYISTAVQAAQYEVEAAKRVYKEAYEAGDPDAVVEAQNAMQLANLRLLKAKGLKPNPLQTDENVVQHIQGYAQQQARQAAAPTPDDKALAWQERNKWFGQDEEMTAAALGLHEKLRNNGVEVGSDEYYDALDKTMRKRFSEFFEEPKQSKPKTVVAPAVRSTASNKIKLSPTQVLIAKKLGLSPEVYAKEVLKLERSHGR